jgi:hypothetical protein
MINITLETHRGIIVLRDDLLTGGTKSRFIEHLLDPMASEYVYASPVYGGFQIALAAVCQRLEKNATIFCAKRKIPHPNSLKCKALGAKVLQVPHGYLNHVQKKAKDYCVRKNAQYLEFGANYALAIDKIAEVMGEITRQIGEPEVIFCAVGSGTLLKGIIKGTNTAHIIGVQVGKEFNSTVPSRVRLLKYPKNFGAISKQKVSFPSCTNYDLKAWEYCLKHYNPKQKTFFWNVMG